MRTEPLCRYERAHTPARLGADPAVGHAVEHRQLLGQPQWIVQREQIAVDEELEPLRALSGRGDQQVWGVHEPVGRRMVLVESHAVVPEPVHGLPGGEVLGVRADGHLRLEVPFG